ncbi:hypothetical protein [Streptomyces sp. WAC08401]|uniref:hypothetical protein n=1 Tax=Streptomyces sp. WAC08401 TaxID=2487413 RepID=UPI000FB62126|nr:hypothetical protein [Streptomyces sp. WAC08401]RSS11437.1 hypothetical protein EF915_25140 [Streptomyces sp. WAC08401]
MTAPAAESGNRSYRVKAYRGTRNWHRRIADYARIVTDGEGKPPAREQAETLRQELAARSQRQGLGWTHIDIQPTNQEQPS